MRRLRSLRSRIKEDFFNRFIQVNSMENAFLSISENLLPGKYKQVICDSSKILLVNENEKDIPAALTQTIEGYWKKSIQIDSALSLYLFLVNVLLRVLDFIRLKILRINYGLRVNPVNKGGSLISAGIVLIRLNGKILMMDSNKKIVYTRHMKQVKRDKYLQYSIEEQQQYIESRACFSSNFPSPKGYGYIKEFYSEELLSGQNINLLSTEERIRTLKMISSSCFSAKNEIHFSMNSFALIERAFEAIDNLLIDLRLKKIINSRKEIILNASKNWKSILCHNDLTAHNLVMCEGEPYVIDLAPHKLTNLPSFLMPATLIHSEFFEYGRSDLLEAFNEGEFDEEFSDLYLVEINDKASRKDVLLSESLILFSIGSKLNENSLKYWIDAIF